MLIRSGGREYVVAAGLEPIGFVALNGAGAGITGVADIVLTVRRQSDGFLYDWDDDTFKTAGWVTPTKALAEVDATNLPGFYRLTATGHVGGWNTATPTNNAANDTLFFYVSGGTLVVNTPAMGECKVSLVKVNVASMSADSVTASAIAADAIAAGELAGTAAPV